LALAFFQDTVDAVRSCPAVSAVIVATSDTDIALLARSHGCLVVDDENRPGINEAARWAGRAAFPGSCIAVVVSDLPCLTDESLTAVLRCARHHQRSFLADAQGTGTTMWLAGPGQPIESRFGRASRAAHLAAGHVDLADSNPADSDLFARARRDVDTAADLVAAAGLGLGPATMAALARAG
jgi:2-phospho-L-lactate guanylyltransferase